MKRIASRFADIGGVRTHYLEAGAGRTIVLVHGGGPFTCAEISWTPLMQRLSSGAHVLALDELGFGFTDMKGDDYSLRARAEHVIRFIEKMSPAKRVTILGNSQGGWIVTYIAIERLDLINKLVLVDSGSVSFEMSNVFPEGYDKFSEFEPTADDVRKMLEGVRSKKSDITPALVKRGLEVAKRNYAAHVERSKRTTSSPEARNANTAIEGVHISHFVDRIKTPTLVIWGRKDTDAAVVDNGFRLFKQIRNADMFIFGDAKHQPFIDFPDQMSKLVLDNMARK